MTLFQHLFSGESEATTVRPLITPTELAAPRPLDAAEVAAVAGGPQTKNDQPPD